jgi:hypothetical protein
MVWSSERQWLADPKVEDDQIGSHMSVVKGKDRGRGRIVCSYGLEREKKRENLEIQ